jgi:hypothetical protein
LTQAEVLIGGASSPVRNHLARALGSMGCKVVEVALAPDALERALETPRDLLVLQVADDPALVRDVVERLRVRDGAPPLLLVSTDIRNLELVELGERRSGDPLGTSHGPPVLGLALNDDAELIVTCTKVMRRDIFGISKYLNNWGVETRRCELTHSRQKDDALSELGGFLAAVECHASICEAVLLTADELVMNAIFNAPSDSDGAPKYSSFDRSLDLQLKPHETVTLTYACDGRHLAVAVADNFGSLSREVIFRYVRQAFRGGTAALEPKNGGAGLGIHMLAGAVTQLVFNVQPGVKTEVIALFHFSDGPRGFRAAGHAFNLFLSQGGGGSPSTQ